MDRYTSREMIRQMDGQKDGQRDGLAKNIYRQTDNGEVTPTCQPIYVGNTFKFLNFREIY